MNDLLDFSVHFFLLLQSHMHIMPLCQLDTGGVWGGSSRAQIKSVHVQDKMHLSVQTCTRRCRRHFK